MIMNGILEKILLIVNFLRALRWVFVVLNGDTQISSDFNKKKYFHIVEIDIFQ